MPLSAPRDSSIVSALSSTAEESITLPRVYHPQTSPTGVGELAVEFAVVLFFGGIFFATAYFATRDLFMACAAVGGFILCFSTVALIAWIRFPKSIQSIEIRDEGVVLNLRGGTQEFIRRETLRSIRTLTLWEYFVSCSITPHHRPGSIYYHLRQYRIDHSEGFICFRPRGDDSFAPMIETLLLPPKDGQPISLPAAAIGVPREMNLHTSTLCIISALGILQFLVAGLFWSVLFFKSRHDFFSMFERGNYQTLLWSYLLPVTNAAMLLAAFTVAFVLCWQERRGAGRVVFGCVGVACAVFVAEVYFKLWQVHVYLTSPPQPRYQYMNWWIFINERELTPAFAVVFSVCLLATTALLIAISRRLADRHAAQFRPHGQIDQKNRAQ